MSQDYTKGVEFRFAYFTLKLAQPRGFKDYTFFMASQPSGLTVQVQLKEGEVYDIINAMEAMLVNMDESRAKYFDVLEFRQSDQDANVWLLTFGFVQAYSQITIPCNGAREAQRFLDELKRFVQAGGNNA